MAVLRFDFDETDSTNTQAMVLAAEHPGEVVLVTAVTQTAGRGRWGRDWQSPAGGAWFSLTLPLEELNDLISLDAAKAVRLALSRWVEDERFSVKPPNDVLLDGKKVAGILCDQNVTPGRSGTTAVVGVGVNVNIDPAALGDDLRHPATSLATALGQELDVRSVIDACAASLCEAIAPGADPRVSSAS